MVGPRPHSRVFSPGSWLFSLAHMGKDGLSCHLSLGRASLCSSTIFWGGAWTQRMNWISEMTYSKQILLIGWGCTLHLLP